MLFNWIMTALCALSASEVSRESAAKTCFSGVVSTVEGIPAVTWPIGSIPLTLDEAECLRVHQISSSAVVLDGMVFVPPFGMILKLIATFLILGSLIVWDDISPVALLPLLQRGVATMALIRQHLIAIPRMLATVVVRLSTRLASLPPSAVAILAPVASPSVSDLTSISVQQILCFTHAVSRLLGLAAESWSGGATSKLITKRFTSAGLGLVSRFPLAIDFPLSSTAARERCATCFCASSCSSVEHCPATFTSAQIAPTLPVIDFLRELTRGSSASGIARHVQEFVGVGRLAKTLFFVRHAESDWNVFMHPLKQERFGCLSWLSLLLQVDHGLSPCGWRQASELRDALQKTTRQHPDSVCQRSSDQTLNEPRFRDAFLSARTSAIICSPMRRALQTANQVFPYSDCQVPIRLVSDIRETKKRIWELDCVSTPGNVGCSIGELALGEDCHRVDYSECMVRWWNRGVESTAQQNRRLEAVLECLVDSGQAAGSIVVTHSNVIKHIAKLLCVQVQKGGGQIHPTLQAAAECKLGNCGVLALKIERHKRDSKELVSAIDACLLHGSRFEASNGGLKKTMDRWFRSAGSFLMSCCHHSSY